MRVKNELDLKRSELNQIELFLVIFVCFIWDTLFLIVGRFIKERKEKDPEADVAVATKFAALPWRLGRESVVNALKDSLSRLGLSSVELYQLHWYALYVYINR